MEVSEIPSLPWYVVNADLFSHAGKDFLILADSYSFYWEIVPLSSTSSKAVLSAMLSVFQHFGIPAQVKSDNGPVFMSFEFRSALKSHGIKLVTSSPYHPRGNSLAERAVQEAKRILQKVESGTPAYYIRGRP